MQSHQIPGAGRFSSGVDRHSTSSSLAPSRTLDHVLRQVIDENRSRRGLALHLATRQLHFAASNNVAEYEALIVGLHIAIELRV
jgi:hypothetical protein